ncbi:ATP-dependent 3'-5' DNA helicase [Emydomyces testavorans]|uniref:ATP-dependent 3'-5' DNA helicase n=1 Tax=Emydomyces testavorans TaxID=2070801 RepID=A0AAF0DM62_9EURO|nr:ATP-dependent 3'-5' DNA helicase [Emydomyces testavorans]
MIKKRKAECLQETDERRQTRRDENDSHQPSAKDHACCMTTETGYTTAPAKQNRGPTSSHTSSSASSRPSSTSRKSTARPKTTQPSCWPSAFQNLSRTHRALNLVYTFCCTRKHFATTFEGIKSAVEAQTGGRPLTVEDVAKIKVLIPRAVRFETVDAGVVDVMSVPEARANKLRQYWDDWEVEGMGRDPDDEAQQEGGRKDEVLLFEFVDGDLRRERSNGTTDQKMWEEELSLPVYDSKHMLNLIEKRNKKFSDAIDAFLTRCQEEGVDPVAKLEIEKDMYLPVSGSSGTNTPAAAKLPPQIPKERKSIAEIIAEIQEQEWYTGQIVPNGHRIFDAQQPVYGELRFQLSQNVVNALYNTKGITQLYSHQAEAINNLHDGHDVIVSTSTSSGKSLIYQIPMLCELEKDPQSRGMYIFPTKALAQDQRRNMQELMQYMDGLEYTMIETFDGDTPMQQRNSIRDEARIIFTNPDMLHITILPQESSWRTFLKNLKFVVVDELHVYNGLFGSHVAFIMRRLRRVCASLGNHNVRFVSCSATVANPEEHMKTIFGVDKVKLTDIDGSPSGRKEFLCWNTPYKDPGDPSSGRDNSMVETARLFCQVILRGARVIAFCRVRKQCEILLNTIRDQFHALDRSNVSKFVMGYRGGYSPQDRRQIEREMFEGKLLGIVATSALELGVDIGSLDAVITHGFPYSISNFRQQSGRAGRRNKDSLSILVGDRYPTDQHYMRNPHELFTKPNCELQVDLENELVLEGHLQCAAFEMPIHPEKDAEYFGHQLAHLAPSRLMRDSMGFYHCHERFRPQPARCVQIRDVEQQHYAVIDTTNNRNAVIEEIEDRRVSFSLYEGGIFLHQGHPYMVKELNTDRRFARVVRVQVDWTTSQRDYTDVDPIETEAIRRINGTSNCRAFFGSIKIHTVVYGYFKIDKRRRILDAVVLDHPPIDILSKGMWLDVPKQALEILASHNLNAAAAIHAAEHAVMSLLPTYVISSPGDVRTECKAGLKEFKGFPSKLPDKGYEDRLPRPRRQRPARLTFYDAKGGAAGSGISSKAFEFVDSLLCRAVARIESCACNTPRGCVECVCDEQCPELSVVTSKAGAGVVLKTLLGMEIDVDALPWGEGQMGTRAQKHFGSSAVDGGEGRELPAGLETIIEAVEIRGKPGGVKVYE